MKHDWIKKALALLVLAALALSLTAFAAEDPESELAAGALEPQVDEQELLLGETIEAVTPEHSAEAADVSAPELPDEAALEEVAQPKAATLTLAAKKVTLGVSEKFSLKPKGSAAKSVKFTTSNGKVAKVSSKGVVTAKKVGKATIKAQVKGKTVAKCVVTVKKKPGKLTLSKSKATLKAGKKLTLKAKLPSGTASHKITWKSSKTRVATVSSKGVVTAKKAGQATITAKTYNGKTAKCKLTVKAGTIKVTLDKQELLLLSGETWQLSATPTSETALTWASDDEAVAKVSKKGLVTAVGPGSAKITVTTSTGHSASCAVTVTSEPYKIGMSYAEYVAADLDTEVTIDAYVQAHQDWWDNMVTIYAADADGAYFLYGVPMSQEDAEKLVPGTRFTATGIKNEWSGEVEIIGISSFEFIEGDTFVAEPVDVTELLGTDALIEHQNQLVAFKGMTVEAYDDTGAAFAYKNAEKKTDDLYFKVSKDGQTYEFCVEFYLCGQDTDVYKAVEALNVGDVVDLEGFLYWYNGANPHITAVTAAE